MTIQLEEQIAVETPLGPGMAIFFETGEDDNWWTILLNDSCAFVTFRQSEIRGKRCYTMKRGISDDEMRNIIR